MKTQEQLLNDIQSQIGQYVYRNTSGPADTLLKAIQEASGNGNLNWHLTQNKEKLESVFTSLAEAVENYTLADGDFRTYLVLKLTAIVTSTYETELFSAYLKKGYNVDPASIVGSLSDAYSTQPPQNTNFPGKDNTSNEYVPVSPSLRLIPSVLYSNTDND
jgi:hypothetical protein